MRAEKQSLEPFDKVLLVDLDGTLIDGNYQPNDPSINLISKKAKDLGFKIGLSSDTPLLALEIWAQRFSMLDPIIAERGAIIKTGNKVIADEEDIKAFHSCRLVIEEEVRKRDLLLWQGNPVEAIRGNLRLGNPGEIVVLLNTLRRCSLSFFVREISQDGGLKINKEITGQIVSEMRDYYPGFSDLGEDLNHDYGILIVMRERVNKRSGTKTLMDQLDLRQIGMIGNSMSDYIGEDIALHYAVKNASDGLKSQSCYVSKYSFTKGVKDIISKIILADSLKSI